MRGNKEIMAKLDIIDDRLIEIERNQDLILKGLSEQSADNYKIYLDGQTIIEKLNEQKTVKEQDDAFLNSMKTKDGLYSRNAMARNKKKDEEGES